MPGFDDLFAPMPTHTNRTARTPRAEGTPSATTERKQSIYFKGTLLEQIHAESARLDRSVSWIVAECVRRAMPELQAMSDVSDPE